MTACVWVLVDQETARYTTSCGLSTFVDPSGFKFCPYCGERLTERSHELPTVAEAVAEGGVMTKGKIHPRRSLCFYCRHAWSWHRDGKRCRMCEHEPAAPICLEYAPVPMSEVQP